MLTKDLVYRTNHKVFVPNLLQLIAIANCVNFWYKRSHLNHFQKQRQNILCKPRGKQNQNKRNGPNYINISRGLYIFYPIAKAHFFVFKEVFQKILSLCMAFIQERLLMKSGLRWHAYGNRFKNNNIFRMSDAGAAA